MSLTFQTMVSKETVYGGTEASAQHGAACVSHSVATVVHSGPALTSTHWVALESSSNQFSHSCSGVMVFLVPPVSRAAQRLVIPAAPYWALGYVQALSC